MLFRESFRKFIYWVRRERAFEELDEEIRLHLEMKAADRGEKQTWRDFGNATRWKEISYEAWGFTWLDSLWQDLRFGMRVLRKSPGVTVTGAISLALGLGANDGSVFAA